MPQISHRAKRQNESEALKNGLSLKFRSSINYIVEYLLRVSETLGSLRKNTSTIFSTLAFSSRKHAKMRQRVQIVVQVLQTTDRKW
jgi:hypothetical protein